MKLSKILQAHKFAMLAIILWLSISCSMFLAFRNEWQITKSTTLNLLCIALYIAMTLTIGFLYYMLYKKKTLEWIFVGFALIMGMIQLFTIPISALPDSNSHFLTVYGESSKLLGVKAYDDDGNILVYSDVFWNTGLTWYPTKDDYVFYTQGVFVQPEATQETLTTRLPLGTKHPGYIPQILGVSLARVLKLNPVQIIHMGRIFALLFYCFIMYWAIKKIPFGKTALFIIGGLPMTLQQAVSYNYDSVLNGICLLTVSWLLYLIYEARKIKYSDIVFLIAATITIATIKFIYLPIMGLGLLIPQEKFATQENAKRNKLIAEAAIIVIGVLSLLFSKFAFLQGELGVSSTTLGTSDISLLWILKNPLTTIGILYRTIERYFSLWVEGLFASPLGYFDAGIDIPSAITIALLVLLLLSTLKTNNSKLTNILSLSQKAWLTFIIGIITLLIMIAILCDTTIGADTIWGVQGRYFLPVVPLILLVCSNDLILLTKNIDKYLLLTLGYLNCMTIFYYTLTVVSA